MYSAFRYLSPIDLERSRLPHPPACSMKADKHFLVLCRDGEVFADVALSLNLAKLCDTDVSLSSRSFEEEIRTLRRRPHV